MPYKTGRFIAELEKKIKFDEDFWSVFGGRARIMLETAPATKFTDAEFSMVARSGKSKKVGVEIGGVEKNFEFHGYSVHAVSAPRISWAGIFKGEERKENLLAYILVDAARGVSKTKANGIILKDAAGNALYSYVFTLYQGRLGKIETETGPGRVAFEKPIKVARAISAFTYLLSNGAIKNTSELKEYVVQLSKELEIGPVSCGTYLRQYLPAEGRRGLGKLHALLTAEAKNIIEFWKKTEGTSDLEQRIAETANLSHLDKATCASYLREVVDESERSKISTVLRKLIANSKDILSYWEKTQGIAGLEERIKETARLARISPITCCAYLLAALSPEKRKGIPKIHTKLVAEAKGIVQLWDATSKITDLRGRVLKTAELARIEPVTCCGYLMAVVPRWQREGVAKLRMELSAQAKGITAYWEKTKAMSPLTVRIQAISILAGIDPITCCSYIASVVSDRKARAEVLDLRRKLAARMKNIAALWEKTKDVIDTKERVTLIAGIAELDPVTCCSYLIAVLPPEQARVLNNIRTEMASAKKIFHKKCGTLATWISSRRRYCHRCEEYF